MFLSKSDFNNSLDRKKNLIVSFWYTGLEDSQAPFHTFIMGDS